MLQERFHSIENLADQIRACLDLRPPIDLDQAIDELGGNLRTDVSLPDECSGRIRKLNNVFEISIRSSQPNSRHWSPRDRFTIAHELGHLFLHMGYMVNPDKWRESSDYKDGVFYRFGHGIEEVEANAFAAALLMPRKEFTQEMISGSHTDFQLIAEHFGTSLSAARRRADILGVGCAAA